MNEKSRLNRLRELQLRRVRRPEIFDKISCLAARALACPTALVTVVDEETQWFVGRTGFDLPETPRDVSFCSVCIGSEAPLLVTDSSQDPRFQNNRLVTEAPFIRSYLGIPLRTEDGVLIGTLCTISCVPNAFSDQDVSTLQSYAVLVEEALLAHDRDLKLGIATTRLLELDHAFEQAQQAAKVSIWRLDLRRNQIRFSDRMLKILELPSATQVNLTCAIEMFVPGDRQLLRKALADAQNLGRAFQLDLSATGTDGTNRRLRVFGKPVHTDQAPTRLVGILADITQNYANEAALEYTAQHDQLTRLINRSGFSQLLDAASRANDPSIRTVMLINLDRFRDTNDALGYPAGDQVIAAIAQRLLHKAGQDSRIARWNGDEFALMLPADTLLDEAISTGMTLLDAVSEDLIVGNEIINVSATCGLAQREGPCSGEDLIRRADLALSFGKQNGGGCLNSWSEGLDGASNRRQHAVATLKHALSQARVFAAYQPMVEIETGEIVGVEALLRIDDGNAEALTATDVFSAIADPLVSRKVSHYMLEQVLRDGPELLKQIGPASQIGINVSEADLRFREGDEDFVHLITRLMHGSALRPNNITLEVTETMLLRDDTGRIRDGLHALDRLGYHIALDDFGTGFSSLTHLRDFPIRKVKIDKEFVAGIAWDHQARLIIQAIVQMSRSLGLDVVAEGVENTTQEMFLRAIGCRYAQGYLYGKAARIIAPVSRSSAQIAGLSRSG